MGKKARMEKCGPCEHLDYCTSQLGNKCREKGGNKIPKFKKGIKQMMNQEPPNTVASVHWKNGRVDHYTAEELEEVRA